MIPINTYWASQAICPIGVCECWAAENTGLRPSLTEDQFMGRTTRDVAQLTCRGISNIFGGTEDLNITTERAQSLLKYVIDISGGVAPRIQGSQSAWQQVVYFLNTRKYWDILNTEELPILPGICRNGPLNAISRLLLQAHNRGMIQLESTITETSEDLA